MTAGILDQIIRQTIANELGLSEPSGLPFILDYTEGAVEVRLPAPSTAWLDYRPNSETSDIVGKGETVDEALGDACVSYRIAAREITSSENLNACRKSLLQ